MSHTVHCPNLTLIDSTHGPLIHMRQADKVDEVSKEDDLIGASSDNQHVQDAVSKGAKILVGGERGDRTAYYPTVLTDVTQDCVRLCHPPKPHADR
jgi:succinate-semialdehyde dehydrogenase/glutarate-semialdehyde dehydrogenase